MDININELSCNSNKRVRLKDKEDFKPLSLGSIKRGSYRVIKGSDITLNNMKKLSLMELLK
jgi:hypothetical protein